jgi:hypothetical protein
MEIEHFSLPDHGGGGAHAVTSLDMPGVPALDAQPQAADIIRAFGQGYNSG